MQIITYVRYTIINLQSWSKGFYFFDSDVKKYMYNNIKQIVQLKLENNKFDEMITRENDKAILEEEQSFFLYIRVSGYNLRHYMG